MQIYQWLELYNVILGIGVIIVFIDAVILLSDVWLKWIPNRARSVIKKMLIPYSMVLAIGAVAGPMIYQYVFAFPPCILCWYNRIFTWPAAIMLMGGMWDKNLDRISKYIYNFAIAAIILGVVHYLSQIGITGDLNCDATGQSVSCSGIDVIVFNFITIPLMAVIVGLGIVSNLMWARKNK